MSAVRMLIALYMANVPKTSEAGCATASSPITGPAIPAAEGAQPKPETSFPNKLPESLVKEMEKVACGFEKDMRKFIRTRDFVARAEQDLKSMNDGESSCFYPAGVRPFKSPVELAELDGILDEAFTDEFTVSIKICKGTTRREAMRIVHHRSALCLKHVHTQSLKEHLTFLKPKSSRQHFFDFIGHVGKATIDNLGLDEPQRDSISTESVTKKAEGLYANLVDKLRIENTKHEKEKEDQQNKVEKLKEKLANEKPERILESIVGDVVQQKLLEKDGMAIDDDKQKNEISLAKKMGKLKVAFNDKPGNGLSPGDGSGHNHKTKKSNKDLKPKGKGLGKSNGKKGWHHGEWPANWHTGKGASWY